MIATRKYIPKPVPPPAPPTVEVRPAEIPVPRPAPAPVVRGDVLIPVRIEKIIDVVLVLMGVTHEDIGSWRRHPRIVAARELIWVLAYQMTTCSTPEIARETGRPNHSTVLTGIKRFNPERMLGNEKMGELLELAREQVLAERKLARVCAAGRARESGKRVEGA